MAEKKEKVEESDEEAIERLEIEVWGNAVVIFIFGLISGVAIGYVVGLFSWIAGALTASLIVSYSWLHVIKWLVVWGNVHTHRYLS